MAKEIIYNYLIDLKKKEVSAFDRAKYIKEYLESNSLSIRKLAVLTNIPKSTIEDWLLWNRISKEKYDSFIKEGYTQTEIYRILRENRGNSKKVVENFDPMTKKILDCNSFILRRKTKFDIVHIDALKNLINSCNYALMYAEKKQ